MGIDNKNKNTEGIQEHPLIRQIKSETKRIGFGEVVVRLEVRNGEVIKYNIKSDPTFKVDYKF